MVFRNDGKTHKSGNNSFAQQRNISLFGDTNVAVLTLCKYNLYPDSCSEALIRILYSEELHVAYNVLLPISGKLVCRSHRAFAQEAITSSFA